ncbi:MAG: SRPBCC family protein, partial [Solirubrobacterales bacterium]|nr:SRPBCC family protein [Solirubrobacterales bacterium]
MANDIQDKVGQILGSDSARALAGTAVSEALKALGSQRSNNGAGASGDNSHGSLSGVKGLAAGAGAAAMAPLAAKGIGKLIKGNGVSALTSGPKKLADDATSKLGDTVERKLKDKVEEAGGPSGILKDTVKSALPFGGGDDDDEGEEGKSGGGGGGATGFGQGRRIMVQQVQYVPVNVKDVYRAWTESEWPEYMHRVNTLDRQIEEDSVRYAIGVKGLWFNKNFTAEVQEQVP